jgi:hypothetical protein
MWVYSYLTADCWVRGLVLHVICIGYHFPPLMVSHTTKNFLEFCLWYFVCFLMPVLMCQTYVFKTSPTSSSALAWLIVVLAWDGVFDETTANRHRWLLDFQSCKVRSGRGRPLPLNTSFRYRQSPDRVCSLWPIPLRYKLILAMGVWDADRGYNKAFYCIFDDGT